jgi:hypothetical protein
MPHLIPKIPKEKLAELKNIIRSHYMVDNINNETKTYYFPNYGFFAVDLLLDNTDGVYTLYYSINDEPEFSIESNGSKSFSDVLVEKLILRSNGTARIEIWGVAKSVCLP